MVADKLKHLPRAHKTLDSFCKLFLNGTGSGSHFLVSKNSLFFKENGNDVKIDSLYNKLFNGIPSIFVRGASKHRCCNN